MLYDLLEIMVVLCLLISMFGMEHPMSRLLPARCSQWRSHSCVVVHGCDFSAFVLYKWWAVVAIQVPLSALMNPLEALLYTESNSSSKESLCFIHKSANENVWERSNLVQCRNPGFSFNLGNQHHLRQLLCIHGFGHADINLSYSYESICCLDVCENHRCGDHGVTSVKTSNLELKSTVFACPARSSYAP